MGAQVLGWSGWSLPFSHANDPRHEQLSIHLYGIVHALRAHEGFSVHQLVCRKALAGRVACFAILLNDCDAFIVLCRVLSCDCLLASISSLRAVIVVFPNRTVVGRSCQESGPKCIR